METQESMASLFQSMTTWRTGKLTGPSVQEKEEKPVWLLRQAEKLPLNRKASLPPQSSLQLIDKAHLLSMPSKCILIREARSRS